MQSYLTESRSYEPQDLYGNQFFLGRHFPSQMLCVSAPIVFGHGVAAVLFSTMVFMSKFVIQSNRFVVLF